MSTERGIGLLVFVAVLIVVVFVILKLLERL